MGKMIWTNDYKADENIWNVKVERFDANHGILSVTCKTIDRYLYRMVPLAYGSAFGPDVDDVLDWKELAEDFIKMRGQFKVSSC